MAAIRNPADPHAPRRSFLLASALILIIMIGLRVEVGGDWFVYLRIHRYLSSSSLGAALQWTDPGYGLINWAAGRLGFGVWAVNTVCAAIFTAGLISLCRLQRNPHLALLVAIPYLVIVVAMGYTRQAAALGMVMLAMSQNTRSSTLKMVVSLTIAVALHKSAVIAIPLIALASSRQGFMNALALFGLAAATYYAFVSGSAEDLYQNYIVRKYSSSGAGIRIAMNLVPALFFLAFRKLFPFDQQQSRLWTIYSVASLMAVVALLVSDSSTAVDRVAIYLIPVQVAILSTLPLVLNGGKRGNSIVVLLAVIVYSLMVQLVWLTSAVSASTWLPYQNYLWLPDDYVEKYHRT